ncbi:uracil-DNA glycosylase family protein [Hahella sp. KA22]|uniref:uracil-DNA glycosylase family protein n=1 Tax=Hahella sp. KA22 TaxID=1628392 RepID=UPI000FDDFC2E|nr:uracil-DNA glycosylase family protein [Hahella sp. KA22]AZZ93586.1 uracil-DNA glycosylase family protein [Hahella sp. KA22]QAY56961.1 uracil-DNA glycosylase family protein [Hahella sp. KA22]
MTQRRINITDNDNDLSRLLQDVRACRLCEQHLEPNPVVKVGAAARLMIIGQAPGTRVHATGIPWNDPSGERLRTWLGLDKETFYDTNQIAIMPMGFCYPGKGRSGDLPPRKECYEHWHQKILTQLPRLEMFLLVGLYAQQAYLPNAYKSLSENVKHWRDWYPRLIPLPHPSPRNTLWLKQRPWFEGEVIPQVRNHVHDLLSSD